jgi:hypothetical protein
MRKSFIMCTVAVAVFAASAIASPRAAAMTIGSPVSQLVDTELRAATSNGYYPPYAYSRYVCRGWWKACGWEPGHYWNYWPQYLQRLELWRRSHSAQ